MEIFNERRTDKVIYRGVAYNPSSISVPPLAVEIISEDVPVVAGQEYTIGM